MDAIIISDLHLGSDLCQAKNLTKFLSDIETDKLILNGDVFESMDFRRLKKHHWKVLSELRKISDKIETIWCAGNHDGPAEIISHLLGITVHEEYILKSGDKKILIFHGDKFDTFIYERPILTWLGDQLYWLIQKMDKSHYWARLAKKSSKHYLHCSENIKKKAIEYAKKLECYFAICGHTHNAIISENYANSGSWTEFPCHYLTVQDGVVNLNEYLPPDKDDIY